MKACRAAGVEYAVVNPFPDIAFLPFPLFGTAHRWGVENVLWDGRDEQIRVFDYRGEPTDRLEPLAFSCGVVPLPVGMPTLSVRLRGSSELFPEFATGRTVLLELESFARRFDARGEDPRAVVAFLDQRMMQTLLLVPLRFAMYVRDDRMLLLATRLDADEMVILLRAAQRLAEHVPSVVASLFPPRKTEGPFEARWMQGSWSPDPTSAATENPAGLSG